MTSLSAVATISIEPTIAHERHCEKSLAHPVPNLPILKADGPSRRNRWPASRPST